MWGGEREYGGMIMRVQCSESKKILWPTLGGHPGGDGQSNADTQGVMVTQTLITVGHLGGDGHSND